MKQLNFYPFYEEYLRSRKKTTTFRLTSHAHFKGGEDVMLSIGWAEDKAIDLHPGRIREVYRRRIKDLNELDFEGESPDCKSPEAAKLVLSCIYKTVVRDDDEVWIVKFEHK
jgi:hypothetical protein